MSQPTPAAKAMDEEEEDDFVKERPQRTSASQVWRIKPLFVLFLDYVALVCLFFGYFRSCLEIFSHVWRFSVILFGDFQSFFFGDFQSFFLEIFSRIFLEIFSQVYEDFQSCIWRFSVILWRFTSLIC